MNNEEAITILRGDVLGTNEQTHEAVFMAIKALKTEPKHGKWKIIKGVLHPLEIDGVCSICDYATGFYHFYNYCPNCGAKMDE